MSYDVVLLGATGYTGQLVAKQLRERFPTLSWAVAGRNLEKLNKLVLDLGTTGRSSYPAVELVSLDDEDAVRALVKRTKVVINTAGPFSEHGEVVLKACATGGKHYVDCAGEMPWLKEMIEKYDTTAKENGAIVGVPRNRSLCDSAADLSISDCIGLRCGKRPGRPADPGHGR
jgi:short subunit dehydrogenase-like uncharacterized protein